MTHSFPTRRSADVGAEVPTGEVGEVVTRSSNNMQGYWNLHEATAKTMTGDGWIGTGDAGYMDEDGYLYIHDRVKDMIITGGENVYQIGREHVCTPDTNAQLVCRLLL